MLGVYDYKNKLNEIESNSDFYLKTKSCFYLYNFYDGLYKVSNFAGINYKILKTKIPYYYSPNKATNNKLKLVGKRIILSNNKFAIIYNTDLEIISLPVDTIMLIDSYKYQNILESSFDLSEKHLIAEIRYLDWNGLENDTIFNFDLSSGHLDKIAY